MKLYLTKITEYYDKDTLDNRMSLLCLQRRRLAESYRNEADRIRSVAAGVLLQKGIEEYLGEEAYKRLIAEDGRPVLNICHHPSGKPYLAAYPDCFFSISHSGDYVGVLFANREVGLDIQVERPCKKELLFKKFHPAELEKFVQMDETAREKYFWQLWCAKEAYVKYTGKGLGESFAGFRVDSDKQVICDGEENVLACITQIDLGMPFCHCAVASETENALIEMIWE